MNHVVEFHAECRFAPKLLYQSVRAADFQSLLSELLLFSRLLQLMVIRLTSPAQSSLQAQVVVFQTASALLKLCSLSIDQDLLCPSWMSLSLAESYLLSDLTRQSVWPKLRLQYLVWQPSIASIDWAEFLPCHPFRWFSTCYCSTSAKFHLCL